MNEVFSPPPVLENEPVEDELDQRQIWPNGRRICRRLLQSAESNPA